jgi:hypothetical protein
VLGAIVTSLVLTPRRPSPGQILRALAASLVALALFIGVFCFSRGQDHFAAISLDRDGKWFANYVINDPILDTDIFFHGIGRSIEHAREAEIIFVGTSRVVFGLNWRVFDAFAQEHRLKMFNMAFAGVMSGNFSKLLIHKWDLKPRLWVVDVYTYDSTYGNSFFKPDQYIGGNEGPSMRRSWLEAYLHVAMIDFRWRWKMALGGMDAPSSYRSGETGNWYNDRWPAYLMTSLPKMGSSKTNCPADPREVVAVRDFVKQLDGDVVLTQVPSIFSCEQRIREMAEAAGVPYFAPNPAGYSTTDGGGHLDGISSARYTREFFAWLEKTDGFRRNFKGQAALQPASADQPIN